MERKIVDNPAFLRDLGKMATCLLMRQARRKGVKMEIYVVNTEHGSFCFTNQDSATLFATLTGSNVKWSKIFLKSSDAMNVWEGNKRADEMYKLHDEYMEYYMNNVDVPSINMPYYEASSYSPPYGDDEEYL
jgi:hypothetical protein